MEPRIATIEEIAAARSTGNYELVPTATYNEQKFKKGDIIHTVDCHCLEDSKGNDIDQNVMFVNPTVITGKYKVVGRMVGHLDGIKHDGYNCITIESAHDKTGGTTAFIGNIVIWENYGSPKPMEIKLNQKENKFKSGSTKTHTRKKTKYLIKRSDGLYEQAGLGAGFWCEDIVRARQYDGYSFARASIEKYEEYIKDYTYYIVKADFNVTIVETIL